MLDMDVLSVCPLLVPLDADRKVYDGYITVKNQDFHIHFNLESADCLKGARIDCEWKLQNLLKGYEPILKQRLEQSPSLAAFLVELKNIVGRQLEEHPQVAVPQPVQYYDKLLAEIKELGWHRLVFIDSGFQKLHLQANDVTGRHHIVQLHLAKEHPKEAPKCVTDLPQPFDFVWTSKSCALSDLIGQFERKLDLYQEFWDMMDEIDQNTWVLEPEKPTRGATGRRIALGNNASVQIEVDPANPRLLPECRFLGADHIINPLRESLSTSLQKWDQGRSLLKNLEAVLNVEFPSPSNTRKEDFSVECGICYAYRLDNHIPDQVCEDPRCNQPFHQVCLYEWLRANPSSRQSFNTMFGECPYCEKPITVKMPVR